MFPLVAIARELMGRGHRVTFLHHHEVGPLLTPFGVDFMPVGNTQGGLLAEALGRASRVNGYFGIRAVIRDFAQSAEILCETLPEKIRDLGIDFIVSDWIEAAGGLVAHHLQLPYVSVAAALPLNWAPGDASPFLGWAYGTSAWHRYANLAVQRTAEHLQRPIHNVIRAYSKKWGLHTNRRVQDWASGFAQISQLPASLDFPRRSLTGCFHYCGPLRSQSSLNSSRQQTNRRRAFASLGSLQGHRSRIFEWIADATERLGLQLVIAHGGRLSPGDEARLSRRAEVHAFVDYASVLRESDVAIMHGGLNGVLDALALGVPLVVVPLAYEQGAIAARVRRSGAGRVCRPSASCGRLAAMIADVLDNPAYTRAAEKIRDDITAAGGTHLAANIIEQVARTGAPCLNATFVAAQPDLARYAIGAA